MHGVKAAVGDGGGGVGGGGALIPSHPRAPLGHSRFLAIRF